MFRSWLVLAAIACNGSNGDDFVDPNDMDGDGVPGVDDCNDDDASIYPGAEDKPYDDVDADCDGRSDYDADGDGYDSLDHGGDDCDDANGDVHPGSAEACNGIDDDCDELVDDEDQLEEGGTPYGPDADADGHASVPESRLFCEDPGAGWFAEPTDCDDRNPAAYPGADTVLCDGSDNDCDPATFESGGITIAKKKAFGGLAAALGAANKADTISLCEGSYDLDRTPYTLVGVTLEGTYGSAVTRITLDPSEQIQLDGGATLRGVTVTGGESPNGGCISSAGGPNDLVDVVAHDCGGDQGGALHVRGELAMHGVVLRNNRGVRGGALYLARGATIVADALRVEDNTAAESGGGAYMENLTTLQGGGTSVFTRNGTEEFFGGGVFAGEDAVLSGVELSHNHATAAGGGLATFDGGQTFSDIAVLRNTAELGSAGMDLNGGASLTGVSFERNEVEVAGAALSVSNGDVVLTDCRFARNVAGATGGAVRLDNGALVATGTDWSRRSDDNVPDDLSFGARASFSWDGVQDVMCEEDRQANIEPDCSEQ